MPEAAAMRDAETTTVPGRVLAELPGALYRVEIESRERSQVTAHVGSGALLRLRPGDEVTVELSPYDETRGRIVGRR
jgi:translation initiation factor IF-1